MTRLHREMISCNYCGNEQPMTLFDLVDLEEDPDLKERILTKELQTFECQNCGRTHFVAHPMIYLDPLQHLVLAVLPVPGEGLDDEGVALDEEDGLLDEVDLDSEAFEALTSLLTNALPGLTEEAREEGYILRVVSSYNALIEKIHIFDDGLNDGAMEVLKLAILTRSLAEDQEKVQALFYLHNDGELLLFKTWDEERGWDDLFIPVEVYENAEAQVEDLLPREGTWQIVDHRRATEWLNRLQERFADEN